MALFGALTVGALAACLDAPTRPHRLPVSLDVYYTPLRCNGATVPYTYYEDGKTCTQTWSATPNVNGIPEIGIYGLVDQRQPIRITFSKPVYHLWIRGIGSIVCSGSYGQAVATTAGGQQITPAFTVTDPADCGEDNVTGSIQDSIPTDEGITEVTITPFSPLEDGKYAQYEVWFDRYSPCPPTGDSILDDRRVRSVFDSSFKASDPDAPQGQRHEHFVAGYKFADGHTEILDVTPPPPQTTDCEIRDFSPPVLQGADLYFIEHSHPYDPGPPPEMVTRCGTSVYDPPHPYQPGPSDQFTGGPKNDWSYLDNLNGSRIAQGLPPVPGYVYDKRNVYRMNPNTPGQAPADSFDTFDHTGKNECTWL